MHEMVERTQDHKHQNENEATKQWVTFGNTEMMVEHLFPSQGAVPDGSSGERVFPNLQEEKTCIFYKLRQLLETQHSGYKNT